MIRRLLGASLCVWVIAMTGCASGPHCNDCNGYGSAGYMPTGPVDAVRQWRRSLTCGAGCGETYYDEWTSTPPDCVDPCPDFGCGAAPLCDACGTNCGGSCCGVRPVRAAARLVAAVYGKRFCNECGYDIDDCGCESSVYDSYGSGCDCASCSGHGHSVVSGPQGTHARVSEAPPAAQVARSNSPVEQARQRQVQMAQQQRQTRQPMAPALEDQRIRQAQRIPQGTSTHYR